MFRNVQRDMWIRVPILGWGNVLRVFESFCRQVFLFKPEKTGDLRIVKTFTIISSNQAAQITEYINRYHNRLKHIGVKVIDRIQFAQESGNDGEISIVQIEDFLGESIESIFNLLSPKQKSISGEIITSALRGVFLPLTKEELRDASGDYCRITVGIDFLDRNMVCQQLKDGTWEVIYIDLVPVKLVLDCGAHGLENPEPENDQVRSLGIFRHYNLVGLIIAFWCHLVKNKPQWGMYYLLIIRRFLKQNNLTYIIEGINSYLKGAELKKMTPEKLEVLMQAWGFADVFRLRVIGCLLAIKASKKDKIESTKQLIKKLFQITHFQSEPLSGEDISLAKKTILQLAKIV